MALTDEQIANVDFWLDDYIEAFEAAKRALADAFDTTWFRFDDWYDDDAVDDLAAQLADYVLADLDVVKGIADDYATRVLSEMTGAPVPILRTETPELRSGVDLTGVYRRPAEQYRLRVARGMSEDEAREKALTRADTMAELDMLGASSAVQQRQFEAHKVTGYRRIVRPELSETGSCGLCIVASDRIYTTDEVLPIHARCKCVTMPIMGEDDPGDSLNNLDLETFYANAGGNTRDKLKATKYAVHEHGELGPLLTYAKDDFRGPSDVKPLEEDPDKAARILKDAIPVLESLQQRRSAGANIQDQLDFQLELVDRLNKILA